MNEELLAKARAQVPDVRLFINAVSKRASQLGKGARRLVPSLPDDERSNLDIALTEIAEGKIIVKAEDED